MHMRRMAGVFLAGVFAAGLGGDPVDTGDFELERATLSNGVVTDSGFCVQAANTGDVNGTGIAWGWNCAQFNDQRQMLTLG